MRHWIGQAGGYLKAEITGETPEKFLSLCTGAGVRFWHVKRKNRSTIVCFLTLVEPELLRPLLRESGCSVRILEKKGIPFYVRKMKTRLGIAAGLILFIAVLLILSNMVWAIQIKGADPKLEEQIRSILIKEHLYVGSLDFFVPDSGQLESLLSARLNEVTWIGVAQEGTTYKIDVVQKKYPKEVKPTGPRNLIASKQAVIHHLFVETGQPVVESNQFVKRGQLLVLGTIGNEQEPRFVSAKGKVIGETWYQSEAVLPLKSRYTLYTGHLFRMHRLQLGGLILPLWGFNQHPYRAFDKETVRKPIRFLIWDLPISYVQIQFREKKLSVRSLTEKEALAEAEKATEQKLLHSLSEDARIISSTIESKTIEKGTLIVHSRQVVYEDIAQPQAIDIAQEKRKLNNKQNAGQ